ncbi:hypothetical protein F2P81_023446 [Scophthalmus maximus]|uniref:Uncharacterized protein n=1 Tax=Scophthalmus maximus TaxID=52904 RepID=A0A6A4S285_SCOMX|nr:hypothetical protein F2P81_023446 [Scophthalmus maximus]
MCCSPLLVCQHHKAPIISHLKFDSSLGRGSFLQSSCEELTLDSGVDFVVVMGLNTCIMFGFSCNIEDTDTVKVNFCIAADSELC